MIAGPASGRLASGLRGMGRLLETPSYWATSPPLWASKETWPDAPSWSAPGHHGGHRPGPGYYQPLIGKDGVWPWLRRPGTGVRP